jgi:hypothetical protein
MEPEGSLSCSQESSNNEALYNISLQAVFLRRGAGKFFWCMSEGSCPFAYALLYEDKQE